MASRDASKRLSHGEALLAEKEHAPYVLRTLLADVPLSAEGDDENVKITCVEFYDSNLYIGTSASEVLHFVQIPPDQDDPLGSPSYILASRLPPAFAEPSSTDRPGIQQILLLSRVDRACILCNWTVTFYSLPELSPVFGTAQIRPCNWIGGLDLNLDASAESKDGKAPSVAVLVSLNRKMRVVKIGSEARSLKTIDFVGSVASIRRDSIACVADSRAYALLDVDRQLKIPLFPISSLDETATSAGQVEDISGGPSTANTSSPVPKAKPPSDDRGHGRSTSLGTFMTSSPRLGQRGTSADRVRSATPDTMFREGSPAPGSLATSPAKPVPPELGSDPGEGRNDKPLPMPPSAPAPDQDNSPKTFMPHLKPHILSPTAQEFFLVTGTQAGEPGVGMFVNLEGDVTRSTLEFSTYPANIILDGRGSGVEATAENLGDEEEGYVLATMERDGETTIEIQRWDIEPGESHSNKHKLAIPGTSEVGIRSVTGRSEICFADVASTLQLKRFHPFSSTTKRVSVVPSLRRVDSRTDLSLQRVTAEQELFEPEGLPEGWEEAKAIEERQFASRLGRSHTRTVAWGKKDVWWIVRNSMSSQVTSQVARLYDTSADRAHGYPSLDRRKAFYILNSLRGHEARSETEFLSLGYARQTLGLLLLASFLHESDSPPANEATRAAHEALLDGALDPRVVMSIIPVLRQEIVEGRSGIWVYGGVRDTAMLLVRRIDSSGYQPGHDLIPHHILAFLKQFLTVWRRKKGFGSVSNDGEVFRSVDAALLVVLLQLDKSSPKGPARSNSVRAELNELVDSGLDCFDRAIVLLESSNRLYILSRLFQSRKMANEVLSTWRRILEGESDDGGEFRDGEQRLRDYLVKIRTADLVVHYGVWLAARNPKLGVQIFAEERAQVRFPPKQVVEFLGRGAPAAVKDYLEYLVFEKNHTEYINDLIAYYLDIVIHELESNDASRMILRETYDTYRALRPPKPTYTQFIADNALRQEWWLSRMRLLQLLGVYHGTSSDYDAASIISRVEPFKNELVPETIILRGRQAYHQEALQLLTHGLGDYDTAINYCLLGGPSMYHPRSGTVARDELPTQAEQTKLFNALLHEFLRIEDISNRVEQTSILLERFGGWFDVQHVLTLIPDSWSVDLVSSFLLRALRRIVRERSDAMVVKSLSAAENLKVSADLVEGVAAAGPVIVNAQD